MKPKDIYISAVHKLDTNLMICQQFHFQTFKEAKALWTSYHWHKRYNILVEWQPYHLKHPIPTNKLRRKINNLASKLKPNEPYHINLVECLMKFESTAPNARDLVCLMNCEGIVNTLNYLVNHVNSCYDIVTQQKELGFGVILVGFNHFEVIAQIFDEMKKRDMRKGMKCAADHLISQECFAKLLLWSTNHPSPDIMCGLFDVSVRCLAWLRVDSNVQGYLEMNNVVMRVLGDGLAHGLDPVIHFMSKKCKNKLQLCEAIEDLLKIRYYNDLLLKHSIFPTILQRLIIIHKKGEFQQIMMQLDEKYQPFAKCQSIGNRYAEIALKYGVYMSYQFEPDCSLLLLFKYSCNNFNSNGNICQQIFYLRYLLKQLRGCYCLSEMELTLFYLYNKTDIVLHSIVSMLSQNYSVLDSFMIEQLLNEMFDVVYNCLSFRPHKLLELYNLFTNCIAGVSQRSQIEGNTTTLKKMIQCAKMIVVNVIKFKQLDDRGSLKYYQFNDELYSYYVILKCVYMINPQPTQTTKSIERNIKKQIKHNDPWLSNSLINKCNELIGNGCVDSTVINENVVLAMIENRRILRSISGGGFEGCTNCGDIDYKRAKEMKYCVKCRKVCYCSRDCQKQHWPRHKQNCF